MKMDKTDRNVQNVLFIKRQRLVTGGRFGFVHIRVIKGAKIPSIV